MDIIGIAECFHSIMFHSIHHLQRIEEVKRSECNGSGLTIFANLNSVDIEILWTSTPLTLLEFWKESLPKWKKNEKEAIVAMFYVNPNVSFEKGIEALDNIMLQNYEIIIMGEFQPQSHWTP